ncbi:hypothetical protein E2C01_014261 [Portunus trituberculatus]|uniref:Uncharacterized protein n=1 Tax=Portunus trituberculatus TaxID=210409 RepID=A0A5B7DJM5_PORTR|nr:hypothetical protein [Portunus trituberculatus]
MRPYKWAADSQEAMRFSRSCGSEDRGDFDSSGIYSPSSFIITLIIIQISHFQTANTSQKLQTVEPAQCLVTCPTLQHTITPVTTK